MRLLGGISTPRRRGMALLSLSLFVAGVLANNAHDVVPPDDPAAFAKAFD
jgi:hypothetical protein